MHVPMYPHARHIPQPPHTAGQSFQGIRASIDPSQVPSPIDTMEADRQQWEHREYESMVAHRPPLSTTNFITLDMGVASPKFVRLSTWSLPSSASLVEECGIPLAAVFQPLADLDPREEDVPLVQCSEQGPMRCEWCRGYVNPGVTWLAGGQKWKCNLCRKETNVSPEYFSPFIFSHAHDAGNDQLKGTVDFSLPRTCRTYWAPRPPPRISNPYYSSLATPNPDSGREPQVMDFVVALDVSRDAITSGFLQSTCEALLKALCGHDINDEPAESSGNNTEGHQSRPWPRGSRVAIITFDRNIHFHHLGAAASPPPILVLPDIDEPFNPLLDGLFVDPYEESACSQIRNFLLNLQRRHEETVVGDSCLGSALRASLACLENRGGIILAFQSTAPRIGSGALTTSPATAASSLFNTDKEYTLYVPANKTWPEIGQAMVEEGVGVCLWAAGQREIGLESIGVVPTLTGGDIFFHPRFDPKTDSHVIYAQLHRVVSRNTGFNASLKVRCSPGLSVAPNSYRGSFFQRTAGEVEFGMITADHAISVTLEVTQKLDERELAFIQMALLYTTMKGERRVRVCNVAIPVVALPGSAFDSADMEVVVSHFAREAISSRTRQPMNHIREDLTEKCSTILLGYRRTCGAATPVSQLLIPEAFRSLPIYTLAILKSKPLKGRNVSPDVRNYHAHRIMSMPVRNAITYFYPPLLPLHDLPDDMALPDPQTFYITLPTQLRDSHIFMTSDGVYMIDNGEMLIFWIGSNVSPQILSDLFGVDDIMKLDPYLTHLLKRPTLLSRQVHTILAHHQRSRRYLPKMFIARQNIDAAEVEFSDMLVEDQNNGAMSYADYLCLIYKQINHAFTQGGSVSGITGLRGSPW